MSEERHPNPSNMQQLLKVCLEASGSAEDAERSTSHMDVETQQWLQSALNSATTSIIEEMLKCIEKLKEGIYEVDAGRATPDTYLSLRSTVATLIDYTGSLDYAQDFHKIGGFDVLKPLLCILQPDVRSCTAELIAELVQNNPYCQEATLSMGFLKMLLDRIENDDNETVRIKCLYAVSCLIRQNSNAVKQFEKEDGFSVLLRAMQQPVEKLQVKSAFLLMNMCNGCPAVGETLFNMGFVEQLVALIHGEHTLSHEYLLGALVALVTNNEQCRKECQRSELRLKEVLENRRNVLQGKEESKEELEYCQRLLVLCFSLDNRDRCELER